MNGSIKFKLIGIYNWLVAWLNPVKLEAVLVRFEHVPNEFISQLTYITLLFISYIYISESEIVLN